MKKREGKMELKMIGIDWNRGIFCHYFCYPIFQEIIIPVSYNHIPALLYCNGKYIGLIEEGYVWCDSFKYEIRKYEVRKILILKVNVKI